METTPASCTLLHFPLSHFCEKARWALDYKEIPYRDKILLPGPHRRAVRRVTGGSTTVPVLITESGVFSESSEIIDELDRMVPERPLTPLEPELAEQARAWEARLDRELGRPIRRVFYHYALEHRRFVVPLYTMGGPWWGPAFYGVAFPAIAAFIRKGYAITIDNVRKDLEGLEKLLDELDALLGSRPFLVGDRFSRADLTLASLLGAALGSGEGRALWPPDDRWPDDLLRVIEPLRRTATATHVEEHYRKYRPMNAPP